MCVIDWQRDGRGEAHLSALIETGDVLVYQVGTWLVDAVPVGDGTPARYRLARADNVQVIWTHNCEHGVLRGHELREIETAFETRLDAEGWPVDVEFGPEQLVARLSEGDMLPDSVLLMLDREECAESVPRAHPPGALPPSASRRRSSSRVSMCSGQTAPPPRLLVSGLSAQEVAVVATAAAEGGWETEVEVVAGSAARLVLFAGVRGEASEVSESGEAEGEAEDEWEEWEEAWGLFLAVVSEELDAVGGVGVVVTVAARAPPPGAEQEDLAAAVDLSFARHVSRWQLRRPFAMQPTDWRPSLAERVMHASLDGAFVSRAGVVEGGADSPGTWWDVSEVAAFDGVVDESLRARLLACFSGGDHDPEAGADGRFWERGALTDVVKVGGGAAAEAAEEAGAGMSRTGGVGLSAKALEALCDEAAPPPAVVELQSRLALLFAAANPPGVGAGGVVATRMSDACFGGPIPPLAGNAPVAADGAAAFDFHIDADPMLLPPSPWTDAFGRYPNRAPGKPRFVTALVYLSPRWEAAWGAPTRFVDGATGGVLRVPPAPGRVCLLDQDVTHAVTHPEPAAGPRPRYSLALKMVLHPAAGAAATAPVSFVDVARWGPPQPFGSARSGPGCEAGRETGVD